MVEQLKNAQAFVQESWIELQRVTWPDYEQLRNATLVVVAFTIMVSGIIWLMDVTVRFLVDLIMGVFGA